MGEVQEGEIDRLGENKKAWKEKRNRNTKKENMVIGTVFHVKVNKTKMLK